MRLRIPLVVGMLIALLIALPTTGANFTDATSSDANEVAARQPIRVTTYQISSGVFTGTSYDLALAEPLASDYFVIMRGAAGANNGSTQRTPDQDYARVSADPFGNLAGGSTSGSTLRLTRGSASGSAWQGQITVVESLDSQATAGFRLRGVAEPTLAPNATAGSAPVDSAWTSMGQVGLYGGYQGGGVSTSSTTRADHLTAWGRVYPTGTNTANIERRTGRNASNGQLSGTTTFSVYAVEWGSEWTIQRVTVAGNNAGNGVNSPSEYDTTTITSVVRDNTFLLASGISDSSGLGRGWEGTVFTLGNGVNQNASENRVAIGAESVANRKAEVYVHTHPQLAVDYRFGPDGSIGTNALTGTQVVDPALVADTFTGGSVARTAGWRAPILTNSSNGTGTAYPRPIGWARHIGSTQITWTRSRSGQPAAYWLQSVDFGAIWR
ncbi:MAG: hypothetical protein WCC01_14165 [Acidimicrobiia bacterium]